MDPLEVREQINTRIMRIEAETPEVFSVEDVVVAGVPLRVYRPGEGSYPVALLVHGGAWVAGSLDTHDNMARYLSAEGQVIVVSVGYTLAPEGKFPKQLEECWEALLWARGLGEPLAVVGDSAGGNMVAVLCLMGRDRDGPEIALQVLINPAPNMSGNEEFVLWQASQVTVGTPVTWRPPRRSVRAELPHTAPTSGRWRKSAPLDKDVVPWLVESSAQQSDQTVPM